MATEDLVQIEKREGGETAAAGGDATGCTAHEERCCGCRGESCPNAAQAAQDEGVID